MSSEASRTFLRSLRFQPQASFAAVVVLPEPCRPAISITVGGFSERFSPRLARAAQHLDEAVVDDLDHLCAGRTERITSSPCALSRTPR